MLGQMIGSGRSDMWFDILKYNKRIALSNSPKLNQKIYFQKVFHKPRGLWYGFSMGKEASSWLSWLYSEMPHWLEWYDYFLEIDVSSANIIKISTEEELSDFDNKYRNTDRDSYERGVSYPYGRLSIDWKKVAKDYDGIEITNFETIVRSKGGYTGYWFDGWDIDSGCVWNTNVIKVVKVKPIEERHQKRGRRRAKEDGWIDSD